MSWLLLLMLVSFVYTVTIMLLVAAAGYFTMRMLYEVSYGNQEKSTTEEGSDR